MNPSHTPATFTKMTGCGNDFILVDNREAALDPGEYAGLARAWCRRRLSVGADGLILIEHDPEVDFRWRIFNRDGTEAEMCGNGARCAIRYAHLKGIGSSRRLSFRTLVGIIRGEILTGEKVKVQVTQPSAIAPAHHLNIAGETFSVYGINTGVPHAVVFQNGSDRLQRLDVERWGKALRSHPHFEPTGTNVDFVAVRDPHNLAVRTYERGVEEETLACGTGAVAAALVAGKRGQVQSPVQVTTSGGEILSVHFSGHGDRFSEVCLEGEARVVYEGRFPEEPSLA